MPSLGSHVSSAPPCCWSHRPALTQGKDCRQGVNARQQGSTEAILEAGSHRYHIFYLNIGSCFIQTLIILFHFYLHLLICKNDTLPSH